jgi:putative ABC transport system permease protein
MNKLVLGNLIHRPLRTLVTMLAVSVEVVMILAIVGIMVGQISGNKQQISGIGADMIVRPSNASFLSGIGGAPVPARIATVLAGLPHIAVAAPVITDLSTAGSIETIWGIDYASYNALKPFVYLSGGPFQGPDDIIVDDYFARADHGHKVGEFTQVKGHPFRICGIVEHGKGGRKFVPIRTLGSLLGNPDNASLFYLRSDTKDNEDTIRQEILTTPGLQQYQVQTLDEWLSLMTPEHLPAFTPALDSVIGIAVVIGFLVIFQSMYTAVLERTREIGILKSLGASKVYILGSVLREAAFVTVCGILIGMVLTECIRMGLSYRFPTLPFIVSLEWRIRGVLIAFAGALLGATYPAWKAARKDPIDALAYE